MPNFNKVIIMGNLVRLNMSTQANGTAVCDATLAVHRTRKLPEGSQEETVFVPVTFWRSLAELVHTRTRAGKCLLVEGHLCMDAWQDRETGKKVSRMKVVADHVQFVSPKDAEGSEPEGERESSII